VRPSREQIRDSLRTEYPWTNYVPQADLDRLVDEIHAAAHARPRCPGCPELVRPEDDFTRDDTGRFWHVDCWED